MPSDQPAELLEQPVPTLFQRDELPTINLSLSCLAEVSTDEGSMEKLNHLHNVAERSKRKALT